MFSPSAIIFLLLIIFILGFNAVQSAYGQNIPDTIDPAFNPQVTTSLFQLKTITATASLPDGKILVSGSFNNYNEQQVGGLVRLNPNGTIDPSFNNGVITAGSFINHIIPLPTGQIIIAGNNFTINGQSGTTPPIMRLNSNGTVDSSFSYPNFGTVQKIVVDQNGEITVSGIFSITSNGVMINRSLIRLYPNGPLNSSFNASTGTIYALAAQNNKIIISTVENSQNVIIRLNEDGSTDSSFTRKILNTIVRDIEVQADGKVLVADIAPKLFRLNENGTDDNSFQVSTYPAQVMDVQINADGKITLGYGSSGATGFRLIRLLPDGSPDSSFAQFVYFYIPGSFTVQSDGGIVIGENYVGGTPVPNGFLRVLPNGIQDTSFNPGGSGFQKTTPGAVRTIEVQSNGKILIGGLFDKVNGVSRSKVARLNADTTLDTTFEIKVGGTGNYFSQILDIFYVVAQPDGKLLVSGSFTYVLNGITRNDFVRLNQDGSIDPTFTLSTVIREYFSPNGVGKNKFSLLGNGKIIVGNSRINPPNGTLPVKLNADGTVDSSFASTIYPTENAVYITDIAVQPDGKILVGGKLQNKSFLVRLNPNGSLDSTFQIDEEANKGIWAFALLESGKILVVKGDNSPFTSLQSRIYRLNADGSPDNTFAAGTVTNGKMNALLALPNGKILVGGKFANFNNQPRQNLVLLGADGALETTNYTINDEVLTLTADSEGRVFIGGVFTSISIGDGQNFSRSYVARLVSAPKPARFDFDGDGKADLATFSAVNGKWSIRKSETNQAGDTQFGQSGDKIVPADFDGDGKTDFAVYRPSNGTWYVARPSGVPAQNFDATQFGAADDKPVPADFDGDGKANIAVWRPSNGIWYILRNGSTPLYYQFGIATDIPVPADFDGDGKTDVAVFRPSSGTFYWLASGSNNQLKGVQFGQTGDVPAIADYNGDGKADLCIFRPSNGTWYQYLTTQSGGYTFKATQFGQAGDEPIAADYDGDGKTDIAIRRQGVWHILRSTQGYSAITFGDANDQAIAALPN